MWVIFLICWVLFRVVIVVWVLLLLCFLCMNRCWWFWVVICGKWVMVRIWLCLLRWCSNCLIILVVGLLMLMLILLKIRVGMCEVCVVIIWIVRLICDSLLFEVILVSFFNGCLGLVLIRNFMFFSLLVCGLVLLLGCRMMVKCFLGMFRCCIFCFMLVVRGVVVVWCRWFSLLVFFW